MNSRTVRMAGVLFAVALCGWAGEPRIGPAVDFKHGDLAVSENKRFLIHKDNTPFFYLGDTAWEIFHRLNREEAEKYLENRRQKGFTVIQAVVLAEFDGLNTPNPYGERPLAGNDPNKPNEAYFRHVDFVVAKAKEKGLYIGMLPTWADKVFRRPDRENPDLIFTPENAFIYGKFLGSRYRDSPNIIWILGGDRPAPGVEPVWRQMAAGLKEGDGGRHLKTFHPNGRHSSGEWLHEEGWLDFNMMQSGHREQNMPNYEMIAKDYARTPIKPTFDGEPRYDDHPIMQFPLDQPTQWFDDFDTRQAAYWAVFAGGFGHTYGVHAIWQFWTPDRKPINRVQHAWYDVLDLPAASQVGYVRSLIESRPFLSRVPDQSIVLDERSGLEHLQATRGDGYLFVYSPAGAPFRVRMGTISGKKVTAWWYDPRTGKASPAGQFPNQGTLEFRPAGEPKRGNDWVLVLDDTGRKFPAPGKSLLR